MQFYNHFDFWTQAPLQWSYNGSLVASVNAPSDLAPPTGLSFSAGAGSITPTFTPNAGRWAVGTYAAVDGGAVNNDFPLTSGTPIAGLSAGTHAIQLFTMGGRDDNLTPKPAIRRSRGRQASLRR